MKIFQFFQEDNGMFSAKRLLAFFSVVCFIVDWCKHIFANTDFNPSWTIISFVLGVVGLLTIGKFAEWKGSVQDIANVTQTKEGA